MDNNLVRLKLKQRLNKLASSDYTNLDCWQEAELLHKGQIQIIRRGLHGLNLAKEGDEQSTTRVDDFQILLKQQELKGSSQELYFETVELPENYMKFKRMSVMAYTKACETPRSITIRLVEEANVDELLQDYLMKPSFKWAETFCTLIGNKARVYTNKEFIIKTCNLTYYRFPKPISFSSCRDWNDEVMIEQEFEFKDDLVELFISEAVRIASADIQDFNNHQRSSNEVETNT